MQKNEAIRVSFITLMMNILLSVGKLIAGIFGHSAAMISDAVHSASDVFSTLIVIFGVKISTKEQDDEHPYGHERLESMVAIILAYSLMVVGGMIGYQGILNIIHTEDNIFIPGFVAIFAAVVSIVIKEWMYWYTRHIAQKVNSDALMADAWHHRSDAFSSVGSLVGIVGARMGFPVLDAVASVIISIFIIKVGVDIFAGSTKKLVDRACDAVTAEQIRQKILSHPEVISLDLFHTRMFGPRIYVDIEIGVDRNLSLLDAHRIAEEVHQDLEDTFVSIKHCMVHVNPAI